MFSTGGAFSCRPRRADLGAARPGRRPTAPGARPRGLALAHAPWSAQLALKAEKMWSVTWGRSGAPSPAAAVCAQDMLPKTVQQTPKKTPRRSRTQDHATSHTLALAHGFMRSIEQWFRTPKAIRLLGLSSTAAVYRAPFARTYQHARAEDGEQVVGTGLSRTNAAWVAHIRYGTS